MSKIGPKCLPNSFIHQFQHVMLNLTSSKNFCSNQMVNLMGKFDGHKSFGNDMDAYFTRIEFSFLDHCVLCGGIQSNQVSRVE